MYLPTSCNMPKKTVVLNQTQRDPTSWIEHLRQGLAQGEPLPTPPWFNGECTSTGMPVVTEWTIPCPSGEPAIHQTISVGGWPLINQYKAAMQIAHFMALPRGDDTLFAAACTHAAILMAIRNMDSEDSLGFIDRIGILIQKDGHPLGEMIRNYALVIITHEHTHFILPTYITGLQMQIIRQMMKIERTMAPIAMIDTLRRLDEQLRAAGFAP